MRVAITILVLLGIYGSYMIKRADYCDDLKKRLYNLRQDMASAHLRNCATSNPFNECLTKTIVFVDDKAAEDYKRLKEEKCE